MRGRHVGNLGCEGGGRPPGPLQGRVPGRRKAGGTNGRTIRIGTHETGGKTGRPDTSPRCAIVTERIQQPALTRKRQHVRIEELACARLWDVLRLGKMRHAIRNGAHHAGHHVTHVDIGNQVSKEKRIAVAHGARNGAAALEQPLRMRDMYVPARH